MLRSVGGPFKNLTAKGFWRILSRGETDIGIKRKRGFKTGPRRPKTALRVLLAGIALILSAVFLYGCPDGPPEAEEVRLGLLAPLSGVVAQGGVSARQAAELKVRAVNQGGGIVLESGKHPLRLIVEDTRSNPQEAVAGARKLINQKGIAALVGPILSRNAIPVARVAEQAGVPMVSPTSTHPETTAGRKYVFRAAVTDAFQGRVLARFALKDLGEVRAAVLFDAAGAYNQTLAKVFRSAFRDLGGELAGFEFYTTGEKDFRDQLNRIRVAGPGVLLLPNYPGDVVLQVAQAREAGLNCFILGSDGWDTMTPEEYAVVGEAFFSTLWAPGPEDDRNRVFINAYKKAYQGSPDAVAALTYDAVGLIVEAVKKGGGIDSGTIREGLAKIRAYPGLAGTISFAQGGDPIKSVSIMAVKEGRPSFFKAFEPE